jgi:hypothetical protein
MTQIRVETLQPKPNIFKLGTELCQTVIILIQKVSSIQNGLVPNDSNMKIIIPFSKKPNVAAQQKNPGSEVGV